MNRYSFSTLFISLFLFISLSAQNEVEKPTAFTYSDNTSILQELMEFSESNPNLNSLFLLEKQPEIEKGQITVSTASGLHSFAYGNMTVTQLYEQILNLPENQILSADELKDQRYNMYYHFGNRKLTQEVRQRLASLLLDELNIKVSQESIPMNRMIITTNPAIQQSLSTQKEVTTKSMNSSPFEVIIQNNPLSKVLNEIRPRPLFQQYQIVDRTELTEDQLLNLSLITGNINDFIATAAEQGLEIKIESGTGTKIKLEPQ